MINADSSLSLCDQNLCIAWLCWRLHHCPDRFGHMLNTDLINTTNSSPGQSRRHRTNLTNMFNIRIFNLTIMSDSRQIGRNYAWNCWDLGTLISQWFLPPAKSTDFNLCSTWRKCGCFVERGRCDRQHVKRSSGSSLTSGTGINDISIKLKQ
jgi:hypothetical protein